MRNAAKFAGLSSGLTSAIRSSIGTGLVDNPARRIIHRMPCDGGYRVDESSRVLFCRVPSIQDTKEATSQIKEAIEFLLHFCAPKSCKIEEATSSSHGTETCITENPSFPQGVMQAFTLLQENHAAQGVVASIASDPDVWVAVLKNPAFVEFFKSHRKYVDFNIGSIDGELETQSSPKSLQNIDDAEESGNPDSYISYIENAKIYILDIIRKLARFVEDLFTAEDGLSYDSPETVLAGGTFMALAMMVIMVVLMKLH